MKRRKEKRRKEWKDDREIVFTPAISPIEAAVIPAREARPLGALHHAKAAFDYDAHDAREKRAGITGLRLRGWGPHRQKI